MVTWQSGGYPNTYFNANWTSGSRISIAGFGMHDHNNGRPDAVDDRPRILLDGAFAAADRGGIHGLQFRVSGDGRRREVPIRSTCSTRNTRQGVHSTSILPPADRRSYAATHLRRTASPGDWDTTAWFPAAGLYCTGSITKPAMLLTSVCSTGLGRAARTDSRAGIATAVPRWGERRRQSQRTIIAALPITRRRRNRSLSHVP